MANTTAYVVLAVILAAAACAAVEEDGSSGPDNNPFMVTTRRMLSSCGSSQTVYEDNCSTAVNVCKTCCCKGHVFFDGDGCQHCCSDPTHRYCAGGCREASRC